MRFVINVLIALVFVAFGVAHNIKSGAIEIDPAWNPWLPLDLTLSDTPVQRWMIERARRDPERCASALARARADVDRFGEFVASPRCGISGGVVLASLGAARLTPVKTRCAVALDLYLWERDSVRPAARDIFGAELASLDHFGSYSCRRIAGSSRWSKHSRAEAIDIAGFRLDTGRHITLLKGWNGTEAEQAFLRRVRDGACTIFGGVLSPDFNAAHADHFHFDHSSWGFCR